MPPGEAGAAAVVASDAGAASAEGGGAAGAVPVDAAGPNAAGSIWDDGTGEDEEAKALIPTHSSSVWISVIVDSKGCVDITDCDENKC